MSTLLSDALLDRGVLLEVCGKDIYLTDNIYFGPPQHYDPDWSQHNAGPTDDCSVIRLLRQMGLGARLHELPRATLRRKLLQLERAYDDTVGAYQRWQQLRDADKALTNRHLAFLLEQRDCQLDEKQLHQLFDQPHHQEEARGPGSLWRGDGVRQFRQHPHSPKIPLALLDPHIAMLVKGLSAVGCYSYCSCQGYAGHEHQWGRQPLRIDFIDQINSDWARNLLHTALASGLALPDLMIRGELLIETDSSLENPERNMQQLWQQATRFGRYLYDNRLALREERRGWAGAY